MPGIQLDLKTSTYASFANMLVGQELTGTFTGKVIAMDGEAVTIEISSLSASKSKKMSTQETLLAGIENRLVSIDSSLGKQGFESV
jgi:hypothetical protein